MPKDVFERRILIIICTLALIGSMLNYNVISAFANIDVDVIEEITDPAIPLEFSKSISYKYVQNFDSEWIWLPDISIMDDIPIYNQRELGLPTGCEIVSLAMMMNKFIDIDVFDLVDGIPRNEDPLKGFSGNPYNKTGFSIFPPALLEITKTHLGNAVDLTGATIEQLQAQIASNKPVLVWVRGMFNFNVHVIVLTGYNESGFFYNDGWSGKSGEFFEYDRFWAMWNDQIIYYKLNKKYPPRIALSM